MSRDIFFPKVQSADNRVQVKKEKYILPKPSEKNNFTRHCCNKTWTNEKDYREHLKIAHTTVRERKYICSICKKDFCTKNQYRKHVDQYHPPFCKICNLKFSSKTELQNHKKQLHPVIYICPVCDVEIIDQREKNKHLREKHPAIYFCSFCSEPFTKYGEVYKHMIGSHEYKLKSLNKGSIPKLVDCDKFISGKWTCIFCGKIFFKKDLYKQHYLEHVQAEVKE